MLNVLGYAKGMFVSLPKEDNKRRKNINAVCRGWSGKKHWKTFKNLLTEHSHIQDVCVLGVYYGRDIAYMTSILNELGRDHQIVGVDWFADGPGPDSRGKKRKRSWAASFAIAPAIEKVTQNLTRLGLNEHVKLVQAEALEFLESSDQQFDLIYIDVSHDYQTTRRGIELARPRLKPNGILGGDDFSDIGFWAVAKAVKELCPHYEIHYGWIWWDKSASAT